MNNTKKNLAKIFPITLNAIPRLRFSMKCNIFIFLATRFTFDHRSFCNKGFSKCLIVKTRSFDMICSVIKNLDVKTVKSAKSSLITLDTVP